MIRELMNLQRQLLQTETMIQQLEDYVQDLIDAQNLHYQRQSDLFAQVGLPSPHSVWRRQFPEESTQAVNECNYGARYSEMRIGDSKDLEQPGDGLRDAANCIGREENGQAARRPV